MNLIFKILIVFLLCQTLNAREVGETEITTEDGIEVYQNEKFYLLKKNVRIIGDNFNLNANNVKVYFNNNLYDIVSIEAENNVLFDYFDLKIKGFGEKLDFIVNQEEITIQGEKSELITEDFKMFSDGNILVNNLNGNFSLIGPKSRLIYSNVFIEGEEINGLFSNNLNKKEIKYLNVKDNNLSYVKYDNTEMYAKAINFDYKKSLIELTDNVVIVRNGQKINGDYGTLDTSNNSYKIKSKNQNKVKVVIQSGE